MTRATEWAKRVKEWQASEESSREYCEGREFSSKALVWWASRFRRLGFPKEAAVRVRGRKAGRKAGLARVVRGADDAARVTTEPAVVIELSGVRVCVEVGCSRASLAMVMDVLRGGAASPSESR